LTGEISLRDVIEDDLPILFEHQLDPEGARMASFTPRDREAFMSHWERVLGDEAVSKKTVVVDRQVVGNVVSFLNDSGDREVGYWIAREHWGKGIATRALAEFLRHERTRPLYAYVANHNHASLRVLEKCGFTVWEKRRPPASEPGEKQEGIVLRLDG
jgi:RimJ/RimL family protein N-acetyltransferase